MLKNFSVLLILIAIIGYSAEIFAAPNLLLRCLAKEEEKLNKRNTQNALYRLNQEFVNELASSNDIMLKKTYVDEICNSRTYSPSVGLLRLLLMKEHELYDLSLSGVDISMRPFKMGYINEFQKQVPRMFIQYLSGLQSEMATPDCLEKNIRELEGFNEKIKYLEEELSTHQLITQKNKINTIFLKLKNFNEYKAKCLAEAKNSGKFKLKKKQNAHL
ncbi:MAG: hypothetical protein H7336_16275 [Bacteriovorax sp.]|nr:hypothetical protein [Bacteriovorax sp.]